MLARLNGGMRPPLAKLLGTTRAAMLELIAFSGGVTGRDISERLGIAVSSASEHATLLRESGLIESRRKRNTVWHSITPLGVALLRNQRATARSINPA